MKIAVLARGEVTRDLVEWLKTQAEVTEYEHHRDIERADLIVSYNYNRIIPGELLDRIPGVNLHIGYLPWNKGAHPAVWAALNGTPMGVTIHWMDAKLDEGKIIHRVKVPYNFDEDLECLYNNLHAVITRLFKSNFEYISNQVGDFHYAKDLESLELPDGWSTTVEKLREVNK